MFQKYLKTKLKKLFITIAQWHLDLKAHANKKQRWYNNLTLKNRKSLRKSSRIIVLWAK